MVNMADFKKIRFNGTFRDYQSKVLSNANAHLRDGKIHIVAAPGSGKTILGLELIRGLGSSAIVLSPSVTIRQQWGERFEASFLPAGENAGDYISYDIKKPALITSITYQALYSAWNKETLTEDDGESYKETEDFSGFDLVKTAQAAGIRTICLDEAHHLRSEWQKALEGFLAKLGKNIAMISLTATPPYDSTPAEWKRYHDLCGDIDDEIFVPSLVAQKTLCPHQDYILFNYPTQQELSEIQKQRMSVQSFIGDLSTSGFLSNAVEQSGILSDMSKYEEVFYEHYDDFMTLFAIAAKFNPNLMMRLPKQIGISARNTFQPTDEDYRRACQLIVDEPKIFTNASDELKNKLTRSGLIHRGKVTFEGNEAVDKALISSMGKMQSIQTIVLSEYQNLGSSLRMLILTDFIGQSHMSEIGTDLPINSMGAVQIFEYLRRKTQARLAVLSGSQVILPTDTKNALMQIAAKYNLSPTYTETGAQGYSRVNISGSNKNKVAIVTEAFQQGLFNVLTGTKALLGEGWDSPCINSLILASFVGSFMLSNQMRGRAIRTDSGNPQKASNIWHLVTLDPTSLHPSELSGTDFDTVKRRFDTFMAPAYSSNVIESGMERLDILKPPFDQGGIARINNQMLTFAANREGMKQRWEAAYNSIQGTSPQVIDADETEAVPPVFSGKLSSSAAVAIAVLVAVIILINIMFFIPLAARLIITAVTAAIGIPIAVNKINKSRQFSSALGSVKIIANAVLRTLQKTGNIRSQNCKADVRDNSGKIQACLIGASSQEQKLFTQAVGELLSPIENPRYIITQDTSGTNSFACPSAIGNKKENAEYLASLLNRTAKDFHVIYTRSENGRRELLKCKQNSVMKNAKQAKRKRVLR